MDDTFTLEGHSPIFDDEDIDWAMGELLHMIGEAKRAGRWPHEYNPLLFYRCMHVIGRQPLEVGMNCMEIVRNAAGLIGSKSR
jgi:hypothetical protein